MYLTLSGKRFMILGQFLVNCHLWKQLGCEDGDILLNLKGEDGMCHHVRIPPTHSQYVFAFKYLERTNLVEANYLRSLLSQPRLRKDGLLGR